VDYDGLYWPISEARGVFRCEFFFRKVSVALFVVICQILFNHELTRLKRDFLGKFL
jgi:hypothetical protein